MLQPLDDVRVSIKDTCVKEETDESKPSYTISLIQTIGDTKSLHLSHTFRLTLLYSKFI